MTSVVLKAVLLIASVLALLALAAVAIALSFYGAV